jgi:hypothetical protein
LLKRDTSRSRQTALAKVDNKSTKDYAATVYDEHWRMKGTSFFYLDGVLHQRKRVNRALNIVYCVKFNFVDYHRPLGRELVLPPDFREDVAYPWTMVRKAQKPAYMMSNVARLLNRNPRTIRNLIYREKIPKPQTAYGPSGRGYWQLYSEEDIFMIRDYFAESHRGRPRKDGMITTWNVPTREQLREKMGHVKMLYVMNDEGEPVPVWLAEEF